MQIPGGIPITHAIVYLIAPLNLLRTETNTSTYSSLRSVAIITSKVLLGPKNIYIKWARRAFNSNIGVSSMDGLVGGVLQFFKSNQA